MYVFQWPRSRPKLALGLMACCKKDTLLTSHITFVGGGRCGVSARFVAFAALRAC